MENIFKGGGEYLTLNPPVEINIFKIVHCVGILYLFLYRLLIPFASMLYNSSIPKDVYPYTDIGYHGLPERLMSTVA